jgi:hypothetical protein
MMRESHDIDLDAEEDYEICDATERQGESGPKSVASQRRGSE